MINIKLYQKALAIKQLLEKGEMSKEDAFQYLNNYRREDPVVFSIETTNICNMSCQMCPRTTQMTRPMGTMSLPLFQEIVEQLRSWNKAEWKQWIEFVKKNYKVKENEMSENNFFLYIVPKVITLHGYGEPLLDKYIMQRIKILKANHIPSYFSTNPNNITEKKGCELLKYGIDYLKFSADDIKLFEKNEVTIKKLLQYNEDNEEKTLFIVDIVGNENDYKKLSKMFDGYNVYKYLKSQDNQWYKGEKMRQGAIHWLEPCQFPWSSMSIMWDGSVVPCGQDFNNEMVMGNVNEQSLYDIWNGEEYGQFRVNHLLKSTRIKCFGRCDMKVLGDYD